MANIVSFDKEKLVEGLDILFHAVAPSLGPRAYAAALDEGFRRRVIDDGVMIASRIILEDKIQNFGANLVAEAAKKTADEAGDATTATIILAHGIIHEALKLIATGVHPMALRAGLEEGVDLLIKEVDNIKTPIKSLSQSIQIATISCKNEKLGKLVAETIDAMGSDGIVTVEESKAPETLVDYQKGMRFDRGYAHPAFVTHPENMEAIQFNTKVLVLDKAISFQGLLALFKQVCDKGESITIIAPAMDEQMAEFLIENKRKGTISALYINAPLNGTFQKDFLQDIAVLTGARYIALNEGSRIEDIKYEDLGEAQKIVSNKNTTLVIEGKGKPRDIKERIAQIKELIKMKASDFDTEKLKERLAKLTTGVAVIKVGGSTEVEMNERKERVIDAVAATRAALEDGIVPGGEISYLSLFDSVFKLKLRSDAGQILRKALAKPFEQLLTNSGLNIGMYKERLQNRITVSIVKEGNWEMDMENKGVDVTTGEVVNMIEKGIIDPAKVIKCALRNSVSVAIQFLTVNVIIAPSDPKK